MNKPLSRPNINTYYIKPTANSPLNPDITLNGTVVADGAGVQEIFEKRVFKAHYEVQDFDCQVLNPNYNIGNTGDLGPDKDGRKMSILVMVSGSVRYWNTEDHEDVRGFTDSLVLVPNWLALGPKAARGEKKWLIQSQTFRLVF